MYDIEKHGDFRRYFDTRLKRNYWVLGYFGGGAVNITDAYELAKKFSEEVKVPIETILIDEVLQSRRFKRFKYIFSTAENQIAEKESKEIDNVFGWLSD